MLFNQDTIIQRVNTAELRDFARGIQVDVDKAESPIVDGNPLFPIPSNSGAFTSLLTTTYKVCKQEQGMMRSRTYFEDVTHSIIKVDGKHSFNDAINTIAETRTLLGDKFAGALLVFNKEIINPLHPVTALSIVDDQERMQRQYKLLVYTYNNRERLDEYYYSKEADKEAIEANLRDITLTCASRIKSREIRVIDRQVSGENGEITYQVAKNPGEDPNKDYLLVAHQIITKGIVAPYYGTSAIVQSVGRTRGIPLTPMLSANISYSNRRESHIPQEQSICTGSEDPNTLHGLRTLTHANLSSPLNDCTFLSGALVYADACIDKSIEFYTLAKIIKEKSDG